MYLHNTEPTVEELLDDPITHLLMTRDRLQAEQVWAFVHDARRQLRDRKMQDRPPTPSQADNLLTAC